MLAALAENGPVLVAVDDAQWIDPASAGALQLGLRRLRDEPVGILATVRTAPEGSDEFTLDRSLPEDRLERLSLGPLSAGALHNLLRERLALELTRPELAYIRKVTAGNPFFALEVGRELVRTGTRPTAARTQNDGGCTSCCRGCSNSTGARASQSGGSCTSAMR